jgi:hypothetical protein
MIIPHITKVKGEKSHVCCDREKSFGNFYHSFLYEKVIGETGNRTNIPQYNKGFM